MPEGDEQEEGAAAAAATAGGEEALPPPLPSPLKSPDAEEDEDGSAAPTEDGNPAAPDGKEKKQKKEKAPKQAKPVKDAKMCRLKNEELDWIWIGDMEDARDCVALRKNNVKYILNCTPPRNDGGVANFHEKDPNFSYCRLSMGDNATEQLKTRFEAAWDFLDKVRIREDGGVLVHCQQGVSRSVSMVIAYLMKYYRYNFDDALKLAQKSRKQACPNEGFTEQLKELEEELRRTNGYEKVPPRRKRPGEGVEIAATSAKLSRGPSGPVGPARGPQGPARGPVGPAVGPQRGPVGPSVGPSVGPAVGPSVGPAVGPAAPEKVKKGPAMGPPVGPAVGPAPGPAKPAKGPVGPAGPSKPKKQKVDS